MMITLLEHITEMSTAAKLLSVYQMSSKSVDISLRYDIKMRPSAVFNLGYGHFGPFLRTEMTKDRSGCRPLIFQNWKLVIHSLLTWVCDTVKNLKRFRRHAVSVSVLAKNLFSIRFIYRTGMYKVNTEATEASARLVTGARRLAGALSKCRLSVVEMRWSGRRRTRWTTLGSDGRQHRQCVVQVCRYAVHDQCSGQRRT